MIFIERKKIIDQKNLSTLLDINKSMYLDLFFTKIFKNSSYTRTRIYSFLNI